MLYNWLVYNNGYEEIEFNDEWGDIIVYRFKYLHAVN